MKLKKCFFLTLYLLAITCAVPCLIHAGTTGKISGKVVDSQTGEPLAGANVLIEGLSIGAATGMNGEFFILNIPPGRYRVTASYMGYQNFTRTEVLVQIDRTTLLNFSLKTTVLAGEEVIVTAYRPDRVEVDLTATKVSYEVAEIEEIAGVNNLTDILELQADVVDDHFRGGRIGESVYLIGGATINNPIDNSRLFNPIVTGLQSVEVFTSGFSAEYGNAQSGVVNMVPKEGGNEWQTHIDLSGTVPHYKTWDGSPYSPDNLLWYEGLTDYRNWFVDDPSAPGQPIWIYHGMSNYVPGFNTFSGADTIWTAMLAAERMRYMYRDVGMEYKNKNIDPRGDITIGGPLTKTMRIFLAYRHEYEMPILPLEKYNQVRQLMSNLSWQVGSRDKLRFSYSNNFGFSQPIPSGPLRNQLFTRTSMITKRFDNAKQYGIYWNHIFNPSNFMELNIQTLHGTRDDKIEVLREGDFYNEQIRNNQAMSPDPKPCGYINGHFVMNRVNRKTYTHTLDGSINSQLNKNNLLKAGVQFSYYDIDVDEDQNLYYEAYWSNINYSANPFEGAIYVQDKMEFQGLIANIGFRYDFYDFNVDYYSDIYSPLANPEYDPNQPNYLDRGNPYEKEKALTEKSNLYTRFQPRIGISYPLSESTVFHMNYGSFTQRPSFDQILYNHISPTGAIVVLGNPRMRPENTQAYDMGLVHSLPFGLKFDISAYYKYVQNLVETGIYYDEQQNFYSTYINRDYANIKGFHVNLEREYGAIQGSIRYNYQSSTGKSSSPTGAPVTYFENPPQGQDPIELPDPEDVYLDYDRTHRLVFYFRANTSSNAGPTVLYFKPFANLSLSSTFSYMSGRPYTWDEKGLGLKYNKRTPDEKDLRIRIQKLFNFRTSSFKFYIEGFNILNNEAFNYNAVFGDNINLLKYEKERQNIFIYEEKEPWVTNQKFGLLHNLPRHFRVGIIMDF